MSRWSISESLIVPDVRVYSPMHRHSWPGHNDLFFSLYMVWVVQKAQSLIVLYYLSLMIRKQWCFGCVPWKVETLYNYIITDSKFHTSITYREFSLHRLYNFQLLNVAAEIQRRQQKKQHSVVGSCKTNKKFEPTKDLSWTASRGKSEQILEMDFPCLLVCKNVLGFAYKRKLGRCIGTSLKT